jgi:hypothetical protein
VRAILLQGEKVTDVELSATARRRVEVAFLADMAVNVDPDDNDPNMWYFDHRGNEYVCHTEQLRRPDGRRLSEEATVTVPGVGIVRVGSRIRIEKVHRDDVRVPPQLNGRFVIVTKIHLSPQVYLVISHTEQKGVYAVVPENVKEIA